MEDSFLSLLTVESADDDLYGGKVERIFGRTRMEESCRIDKSFVVVSIESPVEAIPYSLGSSLCTPYTF